MHHLSGYGYLLALVMVAPASAEPARLVTHFPEHDVSRFLFTHFDIATIRSPLNPARSADQRSFASVLPAPTRFEPDMFEVDAFGWVYRMRILDRGDFNRDGVEDLVACFESRAMLGSYNASQLLLVTRYSEHTPAVAIRFEPSSGRYPCANFPAQ